jgi:hypothetical protein
MSKNTLLSNLINYISANSSGNVVVAAPTSGLALDVNGTGRFTGALTGTSATFTGNLTTDLILRSNGGIMQLFEASTFRGGVYTYKNWIGSGTDYSMVFGSNGELNLIAGGGTTKQFTLASTGAATFSSSVTASTFTSNLTSGVFLNNSSGGTNATQLRINNTSGDLRLGIESSAGQAIQIGTLAYAAVLGNQANNALQFTTNGTVRMTIAAGGNVGIGTTTINERLDVEGNFLLRNSGTYSTSLTREIVYRSNTLSYGVQPVANIVFATEGDAAASIRFITRADAANYAERMRITQEGYTKMSNMGSYYGSTFHEIRSNNTNNALQVSNTNATPYGIWIHYPNSSVATTNYEFIYTSNNTESKFIVWSNGSVINRTGSYGTISDVKFKENIVDATPKLEDITKLKVRNFNLIGNSEKHLGFIAQEFEEVFPNMIDINTEKGTDGETYKSIKTSVLVPMLVKAIQELKAELDILKNK